MTVSWNDNLREFWGDHQVYVWFRGTWGSKAVRCALMALELWALQQLDAGAPFAEVFDKVLDGNESVAVLGLAVSLCLAFPQASLAQSAPLVTCSHLWGWDIERWIGDRRPVNQMGNWYQDRHLLSANKELNERPHRQRDIRDLLPYLILSGENDLQRRVLADVSAFPEHLPFEYEEEKGNADRVADLTEKMRVFAERGVLDNWRVQQTKDGDGYMIWCDPPSTHTEGFKAESDDHARLNEFFALSLWAQNTLDKRELDPTISMADAWKRVQAIDADTVFAAADEDFHAQQGAAAIAGVAFVLARYSDDDAAFIWAVGTLNRVATRPEVPRGFLVRSSIVPMHPKVFAVHGYSGLLGRNRHVATAQEALLHAALHPLEALASAVFISMANYAPNYPTFCWVLMDLAIGRSIADRDHIPNHHSVIADAHEQVANEKLLRRALRHIAKDTVPELPALPMPWIRPPRFSWAGLKARVNNLRRPAQPQPRHRKAMPDHDGYQRNARIFLWHIAGELLSSRPRSRRSWPAQLVRRNATSSWRPELQDFTIMEMVPPFVDTRREYRGQHTL